MANDDIPVWDPEAVDWDEIRALREMPRIEKVLMSLRLQALARESAMAGIRRQYPDATPEEVIRLYDERVAMDRPWKPRHE